MFWIFIAIVWVIAVGVGLWLIFHSYPDPDRIDVKRYAYRPQGLLTIGVSSGVFLLATVFFSFAQVNTGHVGVVRTFGRISGQINPGISLIAPWQTYDSVNVQVQKQTFENLTAFSAETQNVLITTTINYSVAPTDARDLIARVGTDWFDRLVPNNLNQAFKDEAVKFTAVEHRAEPRADPHGRAQGAAHAALAVLDPRQRPEHRQHRVLEAVRGRRSRPSRRPRRPRCAPRRRCSRRKFEAQSRVAKAKGEADANVTVAEGQAEANRKLNASLSANVLQYIAIQKLNPKLQIAVLPAGTNSLIDPTKLFSGGTTAK